MTISGSGVLTASGVYALGPSPGAGPASARRGDRQIELTGRETALLELLLREAGRTVTRERAIEQICGGSAEPNVVDRYVTRLRRKLGQPQLIRTVRGAGFALRA